MKKYWKPIIALLFLSPILTEMLSANAPPSLFFQPGIFLFFATIGYGFPVLVIREVAVRQNFGLWGLLSLGVFYGLYNEALIARTIFSPFNSPVDIFSIYGLIGNVRIPWTLTISTWHAFQAVVYPIVLVAYFFPETARVPWVGKKVTWLLGLMSLFFGIAAFLSPSPKEQISGSMGHLVFILVSFLFLGWLAWRCPRGPVFVSVGQFTFRWKYPLWGAGLYGIFFLLPLILTKILLPPPLFILYYGGMAAFFVRKLSPYREISFEKMALVGLGGSIPIAFFVILITLPFGKIEQAASSLALITILVSAILFIKRKQKFFSV